MEKLDPDDARPPYVQVADRLRTAVAVGELVPGAQLPTIHVLAESYGVSPGTVKSALARLRDEGLVITRQGKGSYVRTKPATDDCRADGDELGELRTIVGDLAERLAAVERRLGSS